MNKTLSVEQFSLSKSELKTVYSTTSGRVTSSISGLLTTTVDISYRIRSDLDLKTRSWGSYVER